MCLIEQRCGQGQLTSRKFSRRWVLATLCGYQAMASLTAKVTMSFSVRRRLSKVSLFLADQRYQRIQGSNATSKIPVGGRAIILALCWSRPLMEVMISGFGVWRAGTNSQMLRANGHCRKRWSSDSGWPQCLHAKFPLMPLASKFDPTGRALLLIFQRRCFSLGDVLTFHTHAFPVKALVQRLCIHFDVCIPWFRGVDARFDP